MTIYRTNTQLKNQLNDSDFRATRLFRPPTIAILRCALLLAFLPALLVASAEITQAQTLTTLYAFTGGPDGGNPYFGDLILDAADNLYGTTFGGGSGQGVVFKVAPNGTETVLHTFASADGCYLYAGLIQDANGNLYGAAGGCGAYGYGTVFEVTASGSFNLLYSFTGGADGGQPFGGLLLDSAGNLYGTTNEGGSRAGICGENDGCGVVFRVAPGGTETVLYTFAGPPDGANPVAGLVWGGGAQQNLYGATGQGGAFCPASGCGTVFELTPSGTETSLFSFNYTDGSGPGPNRLAQNLVNTVNASIFYGATSAGGTSGAGTIYRVTTTGAQTTLYNFDGGADGQYPYGGVITDAKGDIYGTTFGGAGTGCNDVGCGTIYKLTPAGQLTVLYTFMGGADGGNPAAGLVMDSQGTLYGTTYGYGAHGSGTVFKLTP
jgi:uncharacterized repeat protein (TIGR03803 family)